MNWQTIGATLADFGRTLWAYLTTSQMRDTVRVALAGQPRLLRDMLSQSIAAEPDLRVVVSTGNRARLLRQVDRGGVDWVVLLADATPAAAAACMPQHTPAFVVLSRDAQSAEITMPDANGQPFHQVLANLTLDQLFAILRRRVTE